MTIYSDLNGVTVNAFKVANATLSASSLTQARTFTLPDKTGTFAMTSDITEVGGTRFIDGGNASSTYTLSQIVDGGGASDL